MPGGQTQVNIPILLGLVFILAVLFMPTPQRPAYCGGGSVIWNWQKPPANADHIEALVKQQHAKQVKSNTRSVAYWGRENTGEVVLCEIVNETDVVWLISSDKPDAYIIEQRVIGASF